MWFSSWILFKSVFSLLENVVFWVNVWTKISHSWDLKNKCSRKLFNLVRQHGVLCWGLFCVFSPSRFTCHPPLPWFCSESQKADTCRLLIGLPSLWFQLKAAQEDVRDWKESGVRELVCQGLPSHSMALVGAALASASHNCSFPVPYKALTLTALATTLTCGLPWACPCFCKGSLLLDFLQITCIWVCLLFLQGADWYPVFPRPLCVQT